MFNKDVSENIKNAETIIGQSIIVKGNFHGTGNIIIEGQVEGSVKTNAFLLVGEKAVITADVRAKDAKVSGMITGNIKVDNFLEIGVSADIKGDIEAKELSISRGAKINGRIVMGDDLKNEEKK